MALWDDSPSFSQSSSFPNKVTDSCLYDLFLNLLACHVVSSMNLDSLSNIRNSNQENVHRELVKLKMLFTQRCVFTHFQFIPSFYNLHNCTVEDISLTLQLEVIKLQNNVMLRQISREESSKIWPFGEKNCQPLA